MNWQILPYYSHPNLFLGRNHRRQLRFVFVALDLFFFPLQVVVEVMGHNHGLIQRRKAVRPRNIYTNWETILGKCDYRRFTLMRFVLWLMGVDVWSGIKKVGGAKFDVTTSSLATTSSKETGSGTLISGLGSTCIALEKIKKQWLWWLIRSWIIMMAGIRQSKYISTYIFRRLFRGRRYGCLVGGFLQK